MTILKNFPVRKKNARCFVAAYAGKEIGKN